jgi:hypothetical protein
MIRRIVVASALVALIGPWAAAQEETDYLAAFIDGKKVGYAIHTRKVEGDKVLSTDDTSITVSRLGFPITIQVTQTSVETLRGRPLSFESVQLVSGMSMKVSGIVEPNGIVNVISSSMGQQSKSAAPWPEGAVMAEGLRLLTLQKGFKQGTQYTAVIFDPSLMEAMEAKVTVGEKKPVDLLGRIVTLTEMTTVMSAPNAGEITSTSYVDEDGEPLKSVIPIAGMQVEMVSCAKDFALGDVDVVEMIGNMFVDSPTPLRDLGSIASIRYWLAPTADANLVIPTTDNQKVERLQNGTILLAVEPVAARPGGTFPYKGHDPKLLEAIQPTRFLQSDRKEIIDLARKAVGNAKDAATAARRIESFVADYIEDKSMSVGYASAAEVAASRQGDCSEFAVLTAALCRAVGIPAQVAVGVVYVSDFAGHEGFGGHAWTQAYIQGKWVGLDAAFKSSGRGGYDAGHITLAVGNGEPAAFFNIATTLGRFKIEKLQIQKAN